MAKTDSKSDSKPAVRANDASKVVHLALDVADRSQTTAIAILQDARVELRAAAEGGIELAEKITLGVFRFAKKVVTKLDEAGNDTLANVERTLSSAVKSAREPKKPELASVPATA